MCSIKAFQSQRAGVLDIICGCRFRIRFPLYARLRGCFVGSALRGIGFECFPSGKSRQQKSDYHANHRDLRAPALLTREVAGGLRHFTRALDLGLSRRLSFGFLALTQREAHLDITPLLWAEIVAMPSEPVPGLS